MATENKNLSDVGNVPDAQPHWRFGIVKSSWNSEITDGLYHGALSLLKAKGVDSDKIISCEVPGSFELALAAQWIIEKHDVNAVICLGSLIRGETAHFDFVAQGTVKGISDVMIKSGVPVIFGVLTDDHIEQSRARSGGKHGNKGTEAAATALKMLQLRDQL